MVGQSRFRALGQGDMARGGIIHETHDVFIAILSEYTTGAITGRTGGGN
jgi:hypothetical protein